MNMKTCIAYDPIYEEVRRRLRAAVSVEGDDWAVGISWDSLLDIKRHLGYSDEYVIEVYPREVDLVNATAMRHLWVLPVPLDIGWFQ
jgi:hypothetical protein